MRIIIFTLFISLFFAEYSSAQSAVTAIEQGQEINVLYRNEAVGMITAHSRGFGAGYRRLKHVTGKSKRFLEVEVLNMRHPKEFKVHYEGKGSAKGFYYGKLNSIFMLRGGVGMQNVLYERAERKSVEIRCSYAIGPNITFAKPVHLYVFVENQKDPVIRQYDPEIHKLENIAGRAPFVYGFDKTRIYPGGYGKLAFSFEYADYSNEVKAIETGVIADVFPVAVPTMANFNKEQFFVTLYISFVFGKKWF
jgi:hypothetical protein